MTRQPHKGFPPVGRLLWKPADQLTEADMFECQERIARGECCPSCKSEWVDAADYEVGKPMGSFLQHKPGCPYNLKLDQMEEAEHEDDWEYEADGRVDTPSYNDMLQPGGYLLEEEL